MESVRLILVIPAFGRLRQENCEFYTSLDYYRAILCQRRRRRRM
jgi:hypothetical protein